jgi:hypothetical protein
MANIRKPDDKEGLSHSSKKPARRLRDLVSGGNWTDNDDIVLIYWSPEDKGRWVMWKDPDPLKEANITVGVPEPDDPD